MLWIANVVITAADYFMRLGSILNDEFKELIIKIFDELIEDTKIDEEPNKRIIEIFIKNLSKIATFRPFSLKITWIIFIL